MTLPGSPRKGEAEMAFRVLRRREDGALLVLEARWGLGRRGRRKQES